MRPRLFLAVSMLVCAWPLWAAQKVFDFADDQENQTPAGFKSAVTGNGAPGDWRILFDDAPTPFESASPKALSVNKRKILAQLSRDKTDEHFPLLIHEGEIFGDFVLTTQIKLVDGAEEQMAGIAFRVQDEKNYYDVRASALGSSFVFYKLVNGTRSPPITAKLEIPKGVWHSLRIECRGTNIRLQLNDKDVLPPMDDPTFSSGKVAFWTKSDAVSYFADTRIVYTPKETLAQVLVNDAIENYPRLLGLKMFTAPAGKTNVEVIASLDRNDIGAPGGHAEKDTLARGLIYHGKDKNQVIVTLPLHDSNGETVAAVKVYMKSFPGETEKTALTRALPIVKDMEKRVQTLAELTQ